MPTAGRGAPPSQEGATHRGTPGRSRPPRSLPPPPHLPPRPPRGRAPPPRPPKEEGSRRPHLPQRALSSSHSSAPHRGRSSCCYSLRYTWLVHAGRAAFPRCLPSPASASAALRPEGGERGGVWRRKAAAEGLVSSSPRAGGLGAVGAAGQGEERQPGRRGGWGLAGLSPLRAGGGRRARSPPARRSPAGQPSCEGAAGGPAAELPSAPPCPPRRPAPHGRPAPASPCSNRGQGSGNLAVPVQGASPWGGGGGARGERSVSQSGPPAGPCPRVKPGHGTTNTASPQPHPSPALPHSRGGLCARTGVAVAGLPPPVPPSGAGGPRPVRRTPGEGVVRGLPLSHRY